MTFEFRPQNRLLHGNEFALVLANRSVYSNTCFQLYLLPNLLKMPRLGLIVSKKINRRANRRNALKRMVREWFRLHQATLPSVDMVIRVKQPYEKSKRDDFIVALTDLSHFIQKRSMPSKAPEDVRT